MCRKVLTCKSVWMWRIIIITTLTCDERVCFSQWLSVLTACVLDVKYISDSQAADRRNRRKLIYHTSRPTTFEQSVYCWLTAARFCQVSTIYSRLLQRMAIIQLLQVLLLMASVMTNFPESKSLPQGMYTRLVIGGNILLLLITRYVFYCYFTMHCDINNQVSLFMLSESQSSGSSCHSFYQACFRQVFNATIKFLTWYSKIDLTPS